MTMPGRDAIGRPIGKPDRPRRFGDLPQPVRRWYLQLIRPRKRALRLLAGCLLILGGLLGFLPVLGFWMIPVGALLAGRDIPFVRGMALRVLRRLRGRRQPQSK
jgi:hypothetical protein